MHLQTGFTSRRVCHLCPGHVTWNEPSSDVCVLRNGGMSVLVDRLVSLAVPLLTPSKRRFLRFDVFLEQEV